MARGKSPTAASKANGANLGIEATLWAAADKLRKNMDAAKCKHVVLGLIFLKYISDAFEEKHAQLYGDRDADPEDPDEYRAANIFGVPKESRWSHLRASAKQPTIGKLVDDAMVAVERDNKALKGVLPKNYARPELDKQRLGEQIDLLSTIGLGEKESRSKDILGRVYEYFLSQFASAEGKKGGQFYTPRYVVRLPVEMLVPYKGRVFDPCCGSGGMFVQSEKFVEMHGGRIGDTFHAWRGDKGAGKYQDVSGFCKSATVEEIREHGHVLTPGRYVGAEAIEDDDESFDEKMKQLVSKLEEQFAEGARLEKAIRKNLRTLGHGA